MAGSYPDQPSRKMAWDADGTVVFGDEYAGGTSETVTLESLTFREFNSTERALLNNDDSDSISQGIGALAAGMIAVFLFFPEQREIDGYYWNTGTFNEQPQLEKSNDSTNGFDGTFTAIGSEIFATTENVKTDSRNNIQTANESNAVCVLAAVYADTGAGSSTIYFKTLHLYGGLTPGQTPDRLLFLDNENTDLEFTKPLDWGNVGRGSTDTHLIKIKNNSASLTANTVQITAEEIGPDDGSAMFTFSTDGINDQGTLNLGNISNGSSQLVYVHLDIPDAQTLDLYDTRISVNQASWS